MRNAFLKALGVSVVVVGMTAYVASAQPKPLTGVDVGLPSQPGSTTVANGQITVVGGGNDIWNSSDNFHYAYFSQTGDFDYVMQVLSLTGNTGDGGWSKVELMARRESPATPGAGPAGTDEHISNMTTRPSSDIPTTGSGTAGVAGVNYRGPQWRAHDSTDGTLNPDGTAWDGVSTWTTPNPVITPNMPNNWVRLERVGSVFYMYWSDNGTTWQMYNPYSPQGWDTKASWPAGTDNPDRAYFTNAWPSTIFVGIAVTAHSDPDITTAVVTNFMAWTPVPIAITTQPPATAAVTASMPLNISVAATGDPVHYEWRKDGTPISRQVGATLSIPITTLDDSGTYTCRVFGGGSEIISSPCVVTVTQDTTPPVLVGARADGTFTTVTVTFDGPMNGTATNTGSYSLNPSLQITAADAVPIVGNPSFFSGVKLTTAKQALQTTYTLTVNNVQDYSGNTIAANSQTTFTSAQLLTGFAFFERWDDANGDLGDLNAFSTALDDTANPVRSPDVASTVTRFDSVWNQADNYNSRLRTYFTPAVNGNYVFYLSSDDNSYLFLSTDETPANMKIIAQESGWSNDAQWTNAGSPVLAADGTGTDGNLFKCSTTFPSVSTYPGPYPMWSGPITLTAGKTYYMEARQNEGGGGDGVGATFVIEGAAAPANGTASALTGNLISWYESIDNLAPSVLTQPAGSLMIAPGTTTNISATVFGSKLSYGWQFNGKDIPGSTGSSAGGTSTVVTYTLSNASLDSIGQYSLNVTNPNGTTVSGLCKVLVTATGVFTIEAEDFDTGGGQAIPAASVMPYTTGAYSNLAAVLNVDYHNLDARDSVEYRTNFIAGENANTQGNMGGTWGSTRMGEWTMTNNFKIGWIGTGDWGNYTRTFPTPAKTYRVFAAQSYDGRAAGQLHGTLGIVSAGVGTTNQTVDIVGTFDCVGSGGWSQNNLVAMTDGVGGPVKTVSLGGTTTIRWNYDSGDADYLVFVPSAVTVPTFTGITANTDGSVTVSWSNGSLQVTDDLSKSPIQWTDLSVSSPYTFTPTSAQPHLFSRVKGSP